MLAYLYPVTFIVALLSIVWFFYRIYKDESTILPNISFWGASVVHAVTIFMTDFSFYYKLLVMLPGELTAFVMVFLLANNLKSTRAFYLSAVGIGLAGYMIYSNFVPETVDKYFFPAEPQTEQEISYNNAELDPDGELLVDIKSKDLVGLLQATLKPYDIKLSKAFPNLAHEEYSELDDYYLLDIPKDSKYKIEKIIDVLYGSGTIDWAEENEIVKLSPIETVPTYTINKPLDYGTDDPYLNKMWAFEKMEVAAYYDFLRKQSKKPKKKVKIAILDTGVEGKHEDLQGNYVSTRGSYDRDKQTHGTHCAGIAASVSNNGLGVASLALNDQFVKVTSIKVLSDYGWGTQDDIVRGMIEAADQGADVISMSLGGPARGNARRAYEEAVKYANKAGAIVVVAAGNSNKDAKDYVPASCKGVIAVSAVDSELNKAKFSNTINSLQMGVAAPGVDILSTVPGNKYAAYSGTSMATPYVAGLLGIMKAFRPKMDTKEAYQILTKTGYETNDTKLTGKMINPLEAVKAIQ